MDESKQVVEIWEATTPSTVAVNVRDRFVPGAWKQIRCSGGPGSPRKLEITVEEREFNQAQIPDESAHLDPFTNGMLVCIQGTPPESRFRLSEDDLQAVLDVSDEDTFEETVIEMDSELTLRRLLWRAEKRSSIARFEFIKDLVDTRYRVGGTQRSVREILDQEAKDNSMRLSG